MSVAEKASVGRKGRIVMGMIEIGGMESVYHIIVIHAAERDSHMR